MNQLDDISKNDLEMIFQSSKLLPFHKNGSGREKNYNNFSIIIKYYDAVGLCKLVCQYNP